MPEQTPAAEAPAAAETQTPAIDPALAATAKDGAAQATRPSDAPNKGPFPTARGHESAHARAAAAIAALETAQKPAGVEAEKPAADAADTAEKPAEGAAETPKPEAEAKPPEPKKPDKLSRGLAIIAEREAAVLRREQEVKRQEAAIKKAAESPDPDLALVKQVKAALATGGEAAALEVLGIDLHRGIEALARVKEPTPEDIARKIAREEYEARAKTLEAQAKAEREAKEAQEAAALQVERVEDGDSVQRAFVSIAEELPYVAAHHLTAEQVVNVMHTVRKTEGKKPTAMDTLRRLETELREAAQVAEKRYSDRAKPATATPAAKPEAAKPASTAKPAVKEQPQQPAKHPNRPEAEVIPQAWHRNRLKPAHERAAEAMRNLKIQ